MKLIYLPLLAVLMLFNVAKADPIDKVAELLTKGNVPELAKLFAPGVEIAIADEENVYTKAQAEIILQKFFEQNKPTGGKLLHKVNSSASYRFGVVILNTSKGPYRVAFNLKEDKGNMQLIELRIDTEKVK